MPWNVLIPPANHQLDSELPEVVPGTLGKQVTPPLSDTGVVTANITESITLKEIIIIKIISNENNPACLDWPTNILKHFSTLAQSQEQMLQKEEVGGAIVGRKDNQNFEAGKSHDLPFPKEETEAQKDSET